VSTEVDFWNFAEVGILSELLYFRGIPRDSVSKTPWNTVNSVKKLQERKRYLYYIEISSKRYCTVMGIATFGNMVNHKDTDMNTGTRLDMDTWEHKHKDTWTWTHGHGHMNMDT
jgi:hypothetical protein